jgi:TorA maturation chaperone TorD
MTPMLPPEEAARAAIYGLLACLLAAPPNAKLLHAIAAADEVEAENDLLVDPWLELAYAAADTDAEAVRGEYERAYFATAKSRMALEHVVELCDTLRDLIAQHEIGLPEQRRFLENRLIPAAERLRKFSASATTSGFYRRLAHFAAAFFRVEQMAFAMPCSPHSNT